MVKLNDMVVPAPHCRAAAWAADRNTPLQVVGVENGWIEVNGDKDHLWPYRDLRVVGRAVHTDDGPVLIHLYEPLKNAA